MRWSMSDTFGFCYAAAKIRRYAVRVVVVARCCIIIHCAETFTFLVALQMFSATKANYLKPTPYPTHALVGSRCRLGLTRLEHHIKHIFASKYIVYLFRLSFIFYLHDDIFVFDVIHHIIVHSNGKFSMRTGRRG